MALVLLGILNWVGISESAKVSMVGAVIAFFSDVAILVTVFTHISFPQFLHRILQNLLCCTRPFPCCALHKALLINGTVLTGKVNRSLAYALITAKESILPNSPA